VSGAGPPLRVSVIGTGSASPEEYAMARAVGAELARAGAVVVCGGLGGVMEGAARGAAEAGGVTVGILPGPDAADANRWVGLPLATGMGEARNALVVRAAEAVVAVGGGWGTLSELALARKMGIPVCALGALPAAGLDVPELVDPAAAAAWALTKAAEGRKVRE